MKKLVFILAIALFFSNSIQAQIPSFKYSGYSDSNIRVGMLYQNGKYFVNNNNQDELDSIEYNYWFQSGPHNTYEHFEPENALKNLKDYLKNVSSLIEIDVHPSISADSVIDWRVYHTDNNEEVNSGWNGLERDVKLSTTLDAIKDFHNEIPDHHVITLWMELKGSDIWSKASPEKLNDLLSKHLNSDPDTTFVYRPKDFLQKNNSSNLREAANNGWPILKNLKGKIIVILFNHNQPNELLIRYSDTEDPLAFIAPNMYGSYNGSGNVDLPTYFNNDNKNNVVFYSLKGDSYADHCYGLEIFRTNRIASTFYINSGPSSTPGVSEYRDFLIQHARWGRAKNIESHNQPYHYSGYLNAEEGEKSIVKLKWNNKYLIIENGKLKLENCNSESAPYYAIVDVWIDYDEQGKFPASSDDSNKAYLIQPVTQMNSQNPNEKIVEVKGVYNPINAGVDGQEVMLYKREKVNEMTRSKDQYWNFITHTDGSIIIQNKFYKSYISYQNNSLILNSSYAQAIKWEIE